MHCETIEKQKKNIIICSEWLERKAYQELYEQWVSRHYMDSCFNT